jgi:hypothetical protein
MNFIPDTASPVHDNFSAQYNKNVCYRAFIIDRLIPATLKYEARTFGMLNISCFSSKREAKQ